MHKYILRIFNFSSQVDTKCIISLGLYIIIKILLNYFNFANLFHFRKILNEINKKYFKLK